MKDMTLEELLQHYCLSCMNCSTFKELAACRVERPCWAFYNGCAESK
jgi:hypothetical protein